MKTTQERRVSDNVRQGRGHQTTDRSQQHQALVRVRAAPKHNTHCYQNAETHKIAELKHHHHQRVARFSN